MPYISFKEISSLLKWYILLMNKEKHIGIIGLGNMGKGLAINIVNKGYKISISSI